jgi:hypothetical protein
LIIYGLYGVLPQKIEFFLTTALRTSNPAHLFPYLLANECNIFVLEGNVRGTGVIVLDE